TGYVAPWIVAEAVDGEHRPLPFDTEGDLRFRSLCQGLNYPPTPQQPDGWFYPGDRGRLRADGLLVITGRNAEIINAGGFKIAPDFVDDIVRMRPAVIDVAA